MISLRKRDIIRNRWNTASAKIVDWPKAEATLSNIIGCELFGWKFNVYLRIEWSGHTLNEGIDTTMYLFASIYISSTQPLVSAVTMSMSNIVFIQIILS